MILNNYAQVDFTKVNILVQKKPILKDICCTIRRGTITAVIGASGSGKTTLLRLIIGLLTTNNAWSISGDIVRFPGLKIAYINHNPGLQVFKNFVYEEFTTLTKDEVAKLLLDAGCIPLLEKRCLELSQGEKLVVAILRNLSLNIDMLVLDEVLVNLSCNKRQWLARAINNFKNAGGTVIIADHSKEICNYADEIILLADKAAKKVDKKTADDFFTRKLLNTVTKLSLKLTPDCDKLKIDALSEPQILSSLKRPISFTFESGEIIGISGDNGSGKTTLLEIIAGIKKPASGSVFWNGEKLRTLRARKKLISFCSAYSTEQFLTNNVEEELKITCVAKDKNKDKGIFDRIIELFALSDLYKSPITALNYGAKQRLAIVINILENSKILIFDEPTYGMDNAAFSAFVNGVKLMADVGKIIIIASHDHELLAVLTNKIINL